jgi:hypothetical protein
MRPVTHRPQALALDEGDVVDGYLVQEVMARRCGLEWIGEAVGPNGEEVTLVVAWRQPLDWHAWPRFRRLARLRAGLKHEALLPVHAVGEHGGRPYLATDRYPRTTFEDLFDGSPLRPARVLTLLAPVCAAFDLAHAHGLVHLSLSGTSLLVEGDRAVLDGFGLVGGPPKLSIESVEIQEVRYCAPEELRGEQVEPASNVYSLAALLVHALTGRPPYEGVHGTQAYGHMVEPPPLPSERVPELDRALDGVIARGMAKDPAERPASAVELLSEAARALGVDLPAELSSGATAGRQHGGTAPIRIRRIPKKPAMIAAVGAAAVAGLVAGALADPFEGSRASNAEPNAQVRALERLDDQRTLLRARLSDSETSQEQAANAAALADAYGRAAARSPQLGSDARAAERAYAELAEAAADGSPQRFAAATEEVRGAERQLAAVAAAPR